MLERHGWGFWGTLNLIICPNWLFVENFNYLESKKCRQLVNLLQKILKCKQLRKFGDSKNLVKVGKTLLKSSTRLMRLWRMNNQMLGSHLSCLPLLLRKQELQRSCFNMVGSKSIVSLYASKKNCFANIRVFFTYGLISFNFYYP